MEKLNILNQVDVRRAATILSQGGIGAMPTETVYGLAADATQLRAVGRIFEAKERPVFDPLIVHVAGFKEAWEVASDIPAEAEKLMRAFWPGPLTVILPKKEIISDLVTAGLATVAVRCPKHEGARALIKALGHPIAAPSANRYGRTSPTSVEDAIKELGDRMDFALDGGPCAVGVESTIVRITDGAVEILRSGGVTLEDIQKIIPAVRFAPKSAGTSEMFPGSGERHYATTTPLLYPAGSLEETIGALESLRSKLKGDKKSSANAAWPRIGFLAFGPVMDSAVFVEQISLSEKKDAVEAAARLFGAMRALDEAKLDWIIAEKFESEGISHAIDDRLTRASAAKSLQPIFESLGVTAEAAPVKVLKRRSVKSHAAKNTSNSKSQSQEEWAPSVTTITRRSAPRRVSSRGTAVETNQEQIPFESQPLPSEASERPKRGRPARAAKKRGGVNRPPASEDDELPEDALPSADSTVGDSKGPSGDFSEDEDNEGEGESDREGRWQDDENADDPEGNGPSEGGPGGGEVDEDSQQRFFAKRGDSLHTARPQRDRGGRPQGGRPQGGRGFSGGPSFGPRRDRPQWQDRGPRRFGRGGDRQGHRPFDAQRGHYGQQGQGQEGGRPFRPQGDFQGNPEERQGGRPFRPNRGGAPFRGRGNFGGRPGGDRPFGQGQRGNFGPRRGGFDSRGPQGGPGQGGGFRPRQGGWRDNPQGGEGGGYRGGFGGNRPWQGQGQQGQGPEGYRGGQGGGFRPRHGGGGWQNRQGGGGRDRFRGGQGGRPFRRPGGGPGGFRGPRPEGGGFRRRPEEGSGGGSEE